jgi:glycosyltransferase involved in cell wall biosynthesis
MSNPDPGSEPKTTVTILYPADPMGIVAGGIDTFIRGILRWAPEDIEISLVGVTTDPAARPVGQWVDCNLGRRSYRFFAAASYDKPETRGRIPLTISYMFGLLRHRPKLTADVLEFHRIEPSILFLADQRPKNAFFHQNMQVIHNADSDILWSKIPGLYFWVQDKLIRKIHTMYAVRRDAVQWYEGHYPDIADRFDFIPTWFDPDTFSPVTVEQRIKLRDRFGFPDTNKVLVTVGRLDTQKDPLFLAKSFNLLLETNPDVHLVYVGDGVLREQLESYIHSQGLQERVSLFGLRSATEIADILRAADLFVLSSIYEGMPMCVLEALGSGLPVVTTDVGEVKLVVKSGENGFVVEGRRETVFTRAVEDALERIDQFSGTPCTVAVEDYTPGNILQKIYKNYRTLAAKAAGGEL